MQLATVLVQVTLLHELGPHATSQLPVPLQVMLWHAVPASGPLPQSMVQAWAVHVMSLHALDPHVTVQLLPAHVAGLLHELEPLQSKTHHEALLQSMPPEHAFDPQWMVQGTCGGHVILPAHALLALQSNVQTPLMHVPWVQAALHAA